MTKENVIYTRVTAKDFKKLQKVCKYYNTTMAEMLRLFIANGLDKEDAIKEQEKLKTALIVECALTLRKIIEPKKEIKQQISDEIETFLEKHNLS